MRENRDLVQLTTRPNEMQAGIVRAILEDAGIECSTAVAGGVMANAEFGMSFVPTAIYVSADDAERAMAVLENTREESIDIDWDEVDVGDESQPGGPDQGIALGGRMMPATIGVITALVLLILLLISAGTFLRHG